jgi:DNA-directed RNA polymerase subunit RPC12/RpoP
MEMIKVVNCSKCGNEITRDRFNISFILERQDFPPSGDWQESVDRYLNDICPNCTHKIMKAVHQIFDTSEEQKKVNEWLELFEEG